MKKLVGLTAIVILFSLTISAQGQNQRQGQKQGQRPNYTPEQMATLQTNKLALRLDLNENQKKAIYKLNMKNAEEREAIRAEFQKNKGQRTPITSDERFERENSRLEKQIAHKTEMKKILTDEQFQEWEVIMKSNKRGGKNKMGNKHSKKNGNSSRKQNINRG